ncbi:MAG: DUF4366 domain-containing protein [Oscillospiraceae bacterium]|nr:DUF4366 domain-containing protein [Oscillospiraceae bacterium]
MTRNKYLIPIFALMLVMGALFFTSPAYAADDPDLENLTVDAVWLTGDMLNIEVTHKLTGVNQTLQVPLSEYAGNSEYVSVQAVDLNGNQSNTIQFKNPFYSPPADPDAFGQSESVVPMGLNPAGEGTPFTPDGTGTVLDNATDGDGKEFFSIESADGNVFYLIVDRQRNADNVYFLNAVTEQDLMALAEKGDGTSQSAVPAPPAQADPTETPSPEPEAPETPASNSGMGSGSLIFIIIGVIAVGGAGYYLKIVKPKKQAADYDADDGVNDYDDYEDGDPGEDGEDE